MRLSTLHEGKRRDLRLFAGLRSINDVKSVLSHGMLPTPEEGGAYFADSIAGAYDYTSYHGEDKYAIVEILVTPGHGGLIDRELNLKQARNSDIDPRLQQSIDRFKEDEPWDDKSYVNRRSWSDKNLPKHEYDKLMAQYTRAMGTTSGDMSISHNIGFRGRPRIVAIYLASGEREQTKIVAKPYDNGEGSYNVGHVLGKLSREQELIKIADKYFDYIQNGGEWHFGGNIYTANNNKLIVNSRNKVVGEYELSVESFAKALITHHPP